MKKLRVLILIILICPLIAGVYGILHDQLTYTISPEYYTKFKFIRFGIDPQMSDRLAVCKIGFLSTWWAGIYIGLAIGFSGLIHRSSRDMRKISFSRHPYRFNNNTDHRTRWTWIRFCISCR